MGDVGGDGTQDRGPGAFGGKGVKLVALAGDAGDADAFGGKAKGDAAADAATGAGDDGCLAGEKAHGDSLSEGRTRVSGVGRQVSVVRR